MREEMRKEMSMNGNELKIIENSLVPVYETNKRKKVVYGSDLHKVLGVKSNYREWSVRRFRECDALEERDFQGVKISTPSGQHKIDHIIPLDIAKEMAMLERNEKGKEVRRYFIEVEKKYKASLVQDSKPQSPMPQSPMPQSPMSQAEIVLWSAQQLVEQERRMAVLEDHSKEVDSRLDELDARTTTRPQVYYTIAGYWKQMGMPLTRREAAALGKTATSLCKVLKAVKRTVDDEKYGMVGSYPVQVLKIVYADWKNEDVNENVNEDVSADWKNENVN